MKVFIVVTIVKERKSSGILSVDLSRVFDNVEKAKAYILDRLSDYDETEVGSLGYYYGHYNGYDTEVMYKIHEMEVL